MNAIFEAIKNLETVGITLEKFANHPDNYNTDYAQYLENLSWEMHKHAKELRELKSFYQV